MTDPIRFMTVNLLHGGADPEHFSTVVSQVSPDVVVTQELGFDCAQILTERYPYAHLVPSDDFRGRGIASRIEAVFEDIAMPRRPGTSARLQIEGQAWNLVGVHLANPIDFPWWTSVRTRTAQLDVMAEWAAQRTGGPLVLAGDFNASPRWPAYRRARAAWPDLVADFAAASATNPERTWAWRPGWRRLLRIDHFFGSGVKVVSTQVVPIDGSDHAAVVVDLVALSLR